MEHRVKENYFELRMARLGTRLMGRGPKDNSCFRILNFAIRISQFKIITLAPCALRLVPPMSLASASQIVGPHN